MMLWNMFMAGLFVSLNLLALAASQQENNRRLEPNADLRQRYQSKRGHTGRINHIRGLNLDEDTLPRDVARRVTIQCSTEPLFRCSSCAEALQIEQDTIITSILEQYPKGSLIASSRKIANAIFMYLPLTEDDQAVDRFVTSLPGVLGLYAGEDFHPNVAEVVEYIGANDARDTYCVTGKGVRVAVLDDGIDYTHIALGGPGTTAAFAAAFGSSISSIENTQRDGLFPTARVVDGSDFVGDTFSTGDFDIQAQPDDDPIDIKGHGTAVASAILAVAPLVDLVGIKVCLTAADGGCPDFAILLAIEFALDPNGDGNMDDKVDILNFSLGVPYTSGYYSLVARAFDDIFEMGVLTIVASGNEGNIPFVLGGVGKPTNAISVGATGNPQTPFANTVVSYSSRGPGENNSIKPDIVAPAGFSMAKAGSGNLYFRASGTSFSAPIVAGAVALLKERCPECSPFAIRTIIMNNADPTVKYFRSSDLRAPVSLVGSGEVQVNKALEAEFYAYCVEEAQPSLSLGLIDATRDLIIRKTIRIVNLSSNAQSLNLGFLFREQQDDDSGAIAISFSRSSVTLGADCGSAVQVEVEFRITASLAPPNVMTSGGTVADDYELLDRQEFDGWITVSSVEKDISLPFLALLRQAADVTVLNPVLPDINGSPVEVPVGLVNNGAGVAQIDSYQLLFVSEDDPENARGSDDPPSDFRYIGYRVLPVFETDCDYLLEFAITTWERTQRLYLHHFEIRIDIDGDLEPEWVLYNTGPIYKSDTVDCRLRNKITGEEECTGFAVDHSTNTANTVLRVCSNNLGIFDPQVINVEFVTYSFPKIIRSDATNFTQILFPDPTLVAPSYDIPPGGSLDDILVSGPGRIQNNLPSLGLLLFTNAYRDSSNTGAATKETEALAILRSGVNDPFEVTPDFRQLPVTSNIDGPTGCTWELELPSVCPSATFSVPGDFETLVDVTTDTSTLRNTTRRLQTLNCPENPVPRAKVNLVTRSPTPPPTVTRRPTASASPVLQIDPTASPVRASANPTDMTGSPTSGVLLLRPYCLATVAVSLLFVHAAFA
jgi:subtilisin family serine protease